MNKKAQSQVPIGLLIVTVMGIAALIIGVIIALTITSTLKDADLLTSGRTSAATINETTGGLNDTGYLLSDFNTETTRAITIDAVWANTSDNVPYLLTTANYSVSQTTGFLTNSTPAINVTHNLNLNVSYTIQTESGEESTTDLMSANFTEGIDRIGEKVPTVLLIVVVVLVLAMLAIIVAVWRKLNLGSGAGTI